MSDGATATRAGKTISRKSNGECWWQRPYATARAGLKSGKLVNGRYSACSQITRDSRELPSKLGLPAGAGSDICGKGRNEKGSGHRRADFSIASL
jgi:hypothetical protein